MDLDIALKLIAQKAYDVGYSAKLHYSTYDIVEKGPGLIGLFSLIIGVFSLYIDSLGTKNISAAITGIGICSLYISFYSETKENYLDAGKKLTRLYDNLKMLHAKCKANHQFNADDEQELERITDEFRNCCLNKQILFASWFAHKKFFWEQQVAWIEENRKFSFWRDKLPLSLYGVAATATIAAIAIFLLL
ncbi:SLATT domain-containing protein [Pseudomonas oryzihabitans]|uniref:SLATT domain-containing protein n=1 Tax=Pseudomonas oryzihabitans TaxID=47885 RepID=UPI0028959572|nr:SLATT domain-containing protein [Pseudomonas oryzihabitans]MDT3722846.1 SLATT domain-containing protein [Pseudomonas oryzihabitans]